MNQIFIIIVIGFIIFILHKLLGNQMLLVCAFVAIIYLIWGDQFQVKGTKGGTQTFINSDPQMTDIMKRLEAVVKPKDSYVYKVTIENINKFIDIYIQYFRSGVKNALDFQLFTDTRRLILNDLMELVVSSNINNKVIEELVKDLSDCTWKYVHVIATKYDISINQPLAHNAFVAQDLF